MRALWRKDLTWLASFAVVGVLLHFFVLMAVGTLKTWVFPDDKYLWAVPSLLGMAAIVLGVFGATHEDLRRTREYLLHRPVSFRQVFLARQAGCLVVLLVWIVVPLSLGLFIAKLVQSHGPVVDASRFWPYLLLDLCLLPAYAAGAVAGALTRRPAVAVIVGAALCTAVMCIHALLIGAMAGSTVAPPAPFAAVEVALVGLLLAAAYRGERDGHDQDRPWAIRRLYLVAGPMVLLLGIISTVGLQICQTVLAEDILLGAYPGVKLRPDGRPALFDTRVVPGREGRWNAEVDAEHRVVASPTILLPGTPSIWHPDKADSLTDSVPLREVKERRRRPSWLDLKEARLSCGIAGECMLSRRDGIFYHVQYGTENRPPGNVFRHALGKTPDGAAFAPGSRFLGHGWLGPEFVLVEPDGALWRYRVGGHASHFDRVALPNGDRFVRELRAPWLDSKAPPPRSAPADIVVRGERGIYEWRDGAFAVPPPDHLPLLEAERARSDLAMRMQPRVTRHDALTLSIEIPEVDGHPGLRHTYRPRTLVERASALGIELASLIRAPAVQLWSAVSPESRHPHRYEPMGLTDVLVASRPSLLVANLLLGLALAFLAWRRLGRLGAPAAERLFWTANVVALGLAAFICYRLLEPKRAWCSPPNPAPVRPLVIQSA
jgi:hypothetical protein